MKRHRKSCCFASGGTPEALFVPEIAWRRRRRRRRRTRSSWMTFWSNEFEQGATVSWSVQRESTMDLLTVRKSFQFLRNPAKSYGENILSILTRVKSNPILWWENSVHSSYSIWYCCAFWVGTNLTYVCNTTYMTCNYWEGVLIWDISENNISQG